MSTTIRSWIRENSACSWIRENSARSWIRENSARSRHRGAQLPSMPMNQKPLA